MTALGRYWGVGVLALLAYGWRNDFGAGMLIVLSLVLATYCFFVMPLWCGAETRADQFCHSG
jgi:hypothetical protein